MCTTWRKDRRRSHAIDGPVAVKISDAAVAHKSDRGGVHLAVATAQAMTTAVDALRAIGAVEFLVEAMAPAGIDLVVGARSDPVFGPVVLLGVGGIATEVYADVAIASVPASLSRLTALPGPAGRTGTARRASAAGPRSTVKPWPASSTRWATSCVANPHLGEIEINPLARHMRGAWWRSTPSS